jgi:hypothetical protein
VDVFPGDGCGQPWQCRQAGVVRSGVQTHF